MTVPVAQYVTDNIAQSEIDVTTGDGPLADYEGIKTRAITLALVDVLDTNDETTITHELVAKYIADIATIRLIPTLIDFYKSKSHLSSTADQTSYSFYDRVATLADTLERLKINAASERRRIEELINDDVLDALRTSAMPVTTGPTDGTRVTPAPHLVGRLARGLSIPNPQNVNRHH